MAFHLTSAVKPASSMLPWQKQGRRQQRIQKRKRPQTDEQAAEAREAKFDTNKTITAQMKKPNFIARIGIGAGKVIATFNQAAKDSVQTMLNTVIPFMAFVALLIGIIQGSGLGSWFAKLMTPLAGKCFWLDCDWFYLFLAILIPDSRPGSGYCPSHWDADRG